MRNIFFVSMTLLKVAFIIFFLVKVLVTLVQQRDPSFKEKALIQFFKGCGILIAMSIIEFGIAFMIPVDS